MPHGGNEVKLLPQVGSRGVCCLVILMMANFQKTENAMCGQKTVIMDIGLSSPLVCGVDVG